jgi:hypothetical protein
VRTPERSAPASKMNLKTLISQLADRRWRRFYFQRRFMRPRLRQWVSTRIASSRAEPAPHLPDPRAEALRDVGLVNLDPLLSPQQCQEIRRYFEQRDVYDAYRPDWPPFKPDGKERHPACHVANHLHEDVIAAPYLLALANDSRIVDLLHHYFGCRPVISYLAAWWSYPTGEGPQQAESFHRDVDDWNFVKLFVYLSDVEAENGPHVYVRSSAHSTALNAITRYPDEAVFESFGRQSVAIQIAKAGSGFLENTFGLHKGTQVERGRRLMFQAVYSLNPLPYGPKRPVGRFDDHMAGDAAARRLNRVYLD